MRDKEATQNFAIANILISHCGEMLNANKIEQIQDEIVTEMRNGPCSWAFTFHRCHKCRFWKQILDASWGSGFKHLTTDDGECTNEDAEIYDRDGNSEFFTSKNFGCILWEKVKDEI